MTILSFAVHGGFMVDSFPEPARDCRNNQHRKTSMKIETVFPLALAIGLLAGCDTETHQEQAQADLQAQAKVTKADAQTTALAQVPNGVVKKA
jgi:hypothetical protein